jgi:hypothetical protein
VLNVLNAYALRALCCRGGLACACQEVGEHVVLPLTLNLGCLSHLYLSNTNGFVASSEQVSRCSNLETLSLNQAAEIVLFYEDPHSITCRAWKKAIWATMARPTVHHELSRHATGTPPCLLQRSSQPVKSAYIQRLPGQRILVNPVQAVLRKDSSTAF